MVSFTRRALVTSLAALVVATGAADAQDKNASRTLSSMDRSFIMQASNGGMTEIELSRIALQNSAHADVKSFAQMMVQDHGKAGKELEAIAASLGAAPPKPPAKTADFKRFAELKGEALDRAYVDRMVRDHKATVALFEKQAASGDSAELKQFASKTLPALNEHLKMINALAEKKK